MNIFHVFLVRPFAALAILMCPLAIYSCWSVVHKRKHHRFDNFLIGFVGLLSIFQSVRLLRDSGLLTLPSNQTVNDAIELLVAGFYLLATRTLVLSSDDRIGAGLALRLARGAPAKVSPDPRKKAAMVEVAPVEVPAKANSTETVDSISNP